MTRPRRNRRILGSIGLLVAGCLWWTPGVSTRQTTLVPAGAVWKYLDNGSCQGTAWRQPQFNDASWPSGPAQLGYGDGDEATVVSFGPDPNNKYITTYFRHSFTVPDPSVYGSLTVRLLRDDGAVVYLNGTEVFRSNMPDGAIGCTTLASTAIGEPDENTFYAATINPQLLASGVNVLAVEVHQAAPMSTDVSFDLELTASTGASTGLTRGPFLQTGTPTSISVKWRTGESRTSRVCYNTDLTPWQTWTNCAVANPNGATEHVITLTGLTPSTKYYYFIGTQGGTHWAGGDADHYFKTSPPVGTSANTRIWVIGDSGTANPDAEAVLNSYLNFTGSRSTDLWLMLGDNAYNDGTDQEYQAAVFNMYPMLLRQTILWPTRGNHELAVNPETGSVYYYDIFELPQQGEAGGVPSGTEAYYSFDYGNVHFICLDSFGSDRISEAPESMRWWLQQDLAATTKDWIIAFWHHPPYSKGSHDSDTELELIEMRENAVRDLEAQGVDLVLTGHSHSYERSFLLDGDMIKDPGSGRDPKPYRKPPPPASHQGAVYAVAGSSGQISGGPLNHPAMFISLNELGSLVLDINDNRLDAKFIDQNCVDPNCVPRDYFTIVKGPSRPGLVPIADTYISEAEPDSNFGSLPTLRVDGEDESGADLRALLQWDVSSIPPGSSVTSATISVNITNPTGGTYQIYQMRPLPEHGDWDEMTVTWNSRGVRGTDILGEMSCPDPVKCTFSLNAAGRALVQGWVNGLVPNRGLVILNTDVIDGVAFDSRETSSPPKLTITFAP